MYSFLMNSILYSILFEVLHFKSVLINFKNSYLLKLLRQVREVMYRALQYSELIMHFKRFKI